MDSQEKFEQEKKIAEKLGINRIGIFPSALIYNVSSEQIEDSILTYLAFNKVDCETDRIYVRAKWNRKWDKYLMDKRQNKPDVPPFSVWIFIRPKKKKSQTYDSDSTENAVMEAVCKTNPTSSQTNLMLLTKDKLNGVLQLLQPGRKIKWKTFNGGAYAGTKLHFYNVLSYIFAEDKCTSKIRYDILSKKNIKGKSHEHVFSMKILKGYSNEYTYNNMKKDPINFIRE